MTGDAMTADLVGGIEAEVNVRGTQSLRYSGDGKSTYVQRDDSSPSQVVRNYTNGYTVEDENGIAFTAKDMSGIGAALSKDDYAYAGWRLERLNVDYDSPGIGHSLSEAFDGWFGHKANPLRPADLELERTELRGILSSYTGAHPEVWTPTLAAVDASAGGPVGAYAVVQSRDMDVEDRLRRYSAASRVDQGLQELMSMRIAAQSSPVLRNGKPVGPGFEPISIRSGQPAPVSGSYAQQKVMPPTVTYSINSQQSATSQRSSDRVFWSSRTEFEGIKVYPRGDLFNPNEMTSWRQGGKVISGTNLERMATGRAPIGTDGKPVNLHHMTQSNDSAIAEMTQT